MDQPKLHAEPKLCTVCVHPEQQRLYGTALSCKEQPELRGTV